METIIFLFSLWSTCILNTLKLLNKEVSLETYLTTVDVIIKDYLVYSNKKIIILFEYVSPEDCCIIILTILFIVYYIYQQLSSEYYTDHRQWIYTKYNILKKYYNALCIICGALTTIVLFIYYNDFIDKIINEALINARMNENGTISGCSGCGVW